MALRSRSLDVVSLSPAAVLAHSLPARSTMWSLPTLSSVLPSFRRSVAETLSAHEEAVRARRVLVHLGLPNRAPLRRSRHELEDILGALDGFLGEVHDVHAPPLLRGGARVLHQTELLLLLLQRGQVVEVHVAE